VASHASLKEHGPYFETRPGGRPRAGTGPGLRKNRERQNPG